VLDVIEPLPRWEYRVENIASAEMLSGLGADGWELIAVDECNSGHIIFRRPAQSFVERVTLEQRARYYESLGLDPGSDR
jgi:hypothetical protein